MANQRSQRPPKKTIMLAVREVQQKPQTKRRCSYRRISLKHQISIATICRELKNERTEEAFLEAVDGRGRPNRLTCEDKTSLKTQLLSSKKIKQVKLDLFLNKAREKWLQCFLRQHQDLIFKKPRMNLDAFRQEVINPENIANTFASLQAFMTDQTSTTI